MRATNQGFDHAKEKIRKALVYEYLKKHTGVREQDVVLACRNGELVFTEISQVLADVSLRNQSSQIFKQANVMFSELAIHQDERWQDCVESVQHCIQMIDCLHSSLFACIGNEERAQQEKFVKSQERLCARITVRLHEIAKEMKAAKSQGLAQVSSRTRSLVLAYLNHVIDQLHVLHSVLSREVELGDFFAEKTEDFIGVKLTKVVQNAAPFRLVDISNVLKALKGEKRLSIQSAFDCNENILLSSKDSLGQAVMDLKKNLAGRRKQIQEIWTAISSMQTTVNSLKDLQDLETSEKLPALDVSGNSSPLRRMVRFLGRFNPIK